MKNPKLPRHWLNRVSRLFPDHFVGALVVSLVLIASFATAQETKQSEREAMYYRYLEFPSYVKGGSIQAHWMADGSGFWYTEGAPANTVIYKVDPKANTKTPLFDTARLRQALTPLLGHEPPYQGLPFAEFTFVDGEKAVKFTVEKKDFSLQLDTYAITQAPALSEEEKDRQIPQTTRKPIYGWGEVKEISSLDGRWFASIRDYNLWLRSDSGGRSVQLTTDGIQDYEWGEEFNWSDNWAVWSPDSSKLAVMKQDIRKVEKIPVVHWLGSREEVEWRHRPTSWRSVPQVELFVVEIASKRQVRVGTGEERDQYIYILGWRPDGSELFFVRMNHAYKRLDLMAADPTTGATRVVLSETQKTFLSPLWVAPPGFTLLPDGARFVWASERAEWNHLYLYGVDATLIRRLTEGVFPIVEVKAINAKTGWVYFTAHGDQQRPYDTHLYRANLAGNGLARLTQATGQHDIQFATSKEFFLDTHSTVERPPETELHRADGTLLQTLAKANIDALKELKWTPPEEFVVTAASRKTKLYGVLYKPYDFDPARKYPVIEIINGGCWSTIVPRRFTDVYDVGQPAWAQLGFIVVLLDGRGTPERGKAFQDVVYGNVGRNEIPDHVAALRQLAEARPYMDSSRVGVYGYSRGGYFATRALLLAPEIYHVGVATSAPVDGAPDEEYLGLNKEALEYASNLRLAGNLKGKLLLIHGTSDVNVPFSQTMKMVEALIRAGKPCDLVVLPEAHHDLSGTDERCELEAARRYFQEYLKP